MWAVSCSSLILSAAGGDSPRIQRDSSGARPHPDNAGAAGQRALDPVRSVIGRHFVQGVHLWVPDALVEIEHDLEDGKTRKKKKKRNTQPIQWPGPAWVRYHCLFI